MDNLAKLNKNNLILIFIGFMAASLILVGLSTFNLIELSPKKYAYVNMEAIISVVNDELSKQNKQNLTNDEISKKLMETKANFDSLLKDYSKKNNAVVFSSIKVIAGADDVTGYFNTKLLELLKKLEQDQSK